MWSRSEVATRHPFLTSQSRAPSEGDFRCGHERQSMCALGSNGSAVLALGMCHLYSSISLQNLVAVVATLMHRKRAGLKVYNLPRRYSKNNTLKLFTIAERCGLRALEFYGLNLGRPTAESSRNCSVTLGIIRLNKQHRSTDIGL